MSKSWFTSVDVVVELQQRVRECVDNIISSDINAYCVIHDSCTVGTFPRDKKVDPI